MTFFTKYDIIKNAIIILEKRSTSLMEVRIDGKDQNRGTVSGRVGNKTTFTCRVRGPKSGRVVISNPVAPEILEEIRVLAMRSRI